MAITNGNIPLVNRKAWQMMNSAPANSAAGAFVVTDVEEKSNLALYVLNATTHYLYHHDEDSWVQIPSGALAGTFGAGACGGVARWSNTVTANGGTTTTVTTTAGITGLAKGKTIRMLTGSQAGKESTISDVIVIPGGTSIITFSPAFSGAVANTDTFQVSTGLAYIMNAGATAAGIFKSYDFLTATWTSLGTTNLPATWGTDGRLVTTPSDDIFSSGTATAGSSTTLTDSTKTWTTNNWTNFQIRIVSGTGIGQIRTIASNTGTVITVSSAWTINPDATSTYAIEGNDDFAYLVGNNAVTMYRYSRSGNTWTVMAPTTARAGSPIAGMSANWVSKTGNATFDSESNCYAGRYIYSFRGGASTLDRFDITGGTAGAGAWLAVTYAGATETFSSGSSYAAYGRYIYIKKDSTNRFFKYSITGNYIEAFSTLLYGDGAAVIGDKLWIQTYQENGVDKVAWVYNLRNTGSELHRLMII